MALEGRDWKKKLFARFFSSPNIQESNKQISESLLAYSRMPLSAVIKNLETTEKGLDERYAEDRLHTFGLNEIAHEKPPSWYALLLSNFKNPFVLLLIFLGIISFFLGENDAVVIIACMVFISVLMRFIQEYRSNLAAEKLRNLVSTTATVQRGEEGQARDKH
jgi:P-type Mg2+ transporter